MAAVCVSWSWAGRVVSDLFRVLKCLDTFTAGPVDDAPAGVYFDAVAAYRRAFPSLDRDARETLFDRILAAPRFIDHFALLVERVRAEAPASHFPLKAMQGLR